jgi:hypothetical protein
MALAVTLSGCGTESSGDGSASPATGTAPDAGQAGEDDSLKILQFIPSGEVLSFTQAAVMFSQPMVALGELDRADQSLLSVDPPVPGRVAWLNQFTLSFVPDSPAMGSMSATVRLRRGIRSLSGAGLRGGPFESSFTLPRLEVEWFREDVDLSPGMALRPAVDAMFNQPVDPERLNAASYFTWGSDDSPSRAPARWARIEYGSRAESRVFQAVSPDELPRATRWALVIPAGTSPQEGLEPLAGDLVVATGTTYGELGVRLLGFDSYDQPDGTAGAATGAVAPVVTGDSPGPAPSGSQDSRDGQHGREAQGSRDGQEGRDGGDAREGTGVLEHPESAELAVRFSNPVRMSEAAAFIDMQPPHPEFTALKKSWLETAASRENPVKDAGSHGTVSVSSVPVVSSASASAVGAGASSDSTDASPAAASAAGAGPSSDSQEASSATASAAAGAGPSSDSQEASSATVSAAAGAGPSSDSQEASSAAASAAAAGPSSD